MATKTKIFLLIDKWIQRKCIPDQLFIPLCMVKHHVKNVFKKLESNDKRALVYKLSQAGGVVSVFNLYWLYF